VKKQNWQPLIDEVWNNRQPADYTGKNMQKRDYMRSWTHSRTIPTLSLEEIRENGLSANGDVLYEMADPRAEFEARILEKTKMENFKSRLSDADRRILELRAAGYSQQEIADRIGFKAPSAVSKRIRQMAKLFDDFVSKEYSEFIGKRIEQ
jgi:DNA-binding CsgD family transcriptional regulator